MIIKKISYFAPTLTQLGEERIGKTEVFPPDIAKSFGCRFESDRSEVVKMFATLGVETSAIILSPLFCGDSIGVDCPQRHRRVGKG